MRHFNHGDAIVRSENNWLDVTTGMIHPYPLADTLHDKLNIVTISNEDDLKRFVSTLTYIEQDFIYRRPDNYELLSEYLETKEYDSDIIEELDQIWECTRVYTPEERIFYKFKFYMNKYAEMSNEYHSVEILEAFARFGPSLLADEVAFIEDIILKRYHGAIYELYGLLRIQIYEGVIKNDEYLMRIVHDTICPSVSHTQHFDTKGFKIKNILT
jgi:hypothetical protein